MKKEDQKIVKKVWGYEIWEVNRSEYCGKLLLLNKGAISSYHKHNIKQETFVCLEGGAILTVEGKNYDLSITGRAKTIFPGEYHKFEGVVRTVLLEISTYHDDNDVERLDESKKGRNSWKL